MPVHNARKVMRKIRGNHRIRKPHSSDQNLLLKYCLLVLTIVATALGIGGASGVIP